MSRPLARGVGSHGPGFETPQISLVQVTYYATTCRGELDITHWMNEVTRIVWHYVHLFAAFSVNR